MPRFLVAVAAMAAQKAVIRLRIVHACKLRLNLASETAIHIDEDMH